MLYMRNYILLKDSFCTVFSYEINREINIYFVNEVLPLPLGKFNEITVDYKEWIKLPTNLFLPLLKIIAGTYDKDEKGKSTGVANEAIASEREWVSAYNSNFSRAEILYGRKCPLISG